MSRRDAYGQRGWIEFEGLKFALPFMTREELVRTIHRFFQERGLVISRTQPVLKIQFTQKRPPKCTESGGRVFGQMDSEHTHAGMRVKEVTVFVQAHSTRVEFVDTLFHELDHCAWVMEGKTFDDSAEYRSRPHEVRAWLTGPWWSKRLSR